MNDCGTCLTMCICFSATLKVALLIGVSKYMVHDELPGVQEDLKLLKLKLEALDFYVTALIDLEACEIERAVQEFTYLLGQGVYGKQVL